MAATESSGDEGSDIFWPGYVDAVTNLVLNLLFVLTIMIVAVLMFAMALSRRHEADIEAVKTSQNKVSTEVVQEKDQRIQELEKQLAQLQTQIGVNTPTKAPLKVANVKTPLPVPDKSVDKLLASGEAIVVNFLADAVTINDAELNQVESLLKPMVGIGAATLVVDVPAGLSEAKRMAFYRVMAVRNVMIKLGMDPQKLEIKLREAGQGADNTKVIVLGGKA